MDCVIMAGGRPKPDDPLYALTQGQPKALIDVGGQTMLERVTAALQQAPSIDDIVVVGLADDAGQRFERPVHHLPDQGSMVANGLAGVRWARARHPDAQALMLCSADIPAITADIVESTITLCRPFDQAIYYHFVTRTVMESAFPGSNRSFVRLRGLEIAGGDAMIIQPDIAEGNEVLWESLTNARKHAWKIARLIGPGTLFKLLFRRLSLADMETTGTRVLGRPVKIILNPHAEIAMDADKPHQVELLRKSIEEAR